MVLRFRDLVITGERRKNVIEKVKKIIKFEVIILEAS